MAGHFRVRSISGWRHSHHARRGSTAFTCSKANGADPISSIVRSCPSSRHRDMSADERHLPSPRGFQTVVRVAVFDLHGDTNRHSGWLSAGGARPRVFQSVIFELKLPRGTRRQPPGAVIPRTRTATGYPGRNHLHILLLSTKFISPPEPSPISLIPHSSPPPSLPPQSSPPSPPLHSIPPLLLSPTPRLTPPLPPSTFFSNFSYLYSFATQPSSPLPLSPPPITPFGPLPLYISQPSSILSSIPLPSSPILPPPLL